MTEAAETSDVQTTASALQVQKPTKAVATKTAAVTKTAPAKTGTAAKTKAPAIKGSKANPPRTRAKGQKEDTEAGADSADGEENTAQSALDSDPSGSEDSSDESSEEEPDRAEASSSEEEDSAEAPAYRRSKHVPDPFSPGWYQQRPRCYTEETLQVPASHRQNYPRPFVIRNAKFNRTLANSSTGAKQEAEVLYTLAAFGALRLNQCHEFLEDNPKLKPKVRDHLEEGWLYQLGLYEYAVARLDIIEGLQGDSQSQALAQIQQARVRPPQGRGAISAETYEIYLPADTRARVTAAASRKPGHSQTSNKTSSSSPSASKTPKKDKTRKSKQSGTRSSK